MKMDALRVIGSAVVDLPLLGADGSGPFMLKSVEGLGPPEGTVRMARGIGGKGVRQGRTTSLRQLTMLIQLQPEWDVGQTPEELRRVLYSLLTPKFGKPVRVEVRHKGVFQGFAQGDVSKVEVALFTKDPAVVVTIDCDDTYFLAAGDVLVAPPQRTEGGIVAFDVDNAGDAPTGFVMAVTLRGPAVTTMFLSDSDPNGQKIQIEDVTWNPGDRLKIDTRAGSRGVWRGANGGNFASVLSGLNAEVSTWMQLHGGINTLRLNTTAFDWDASVKFTHQPAYWGV